MDFLKNHVVVFFPNSDDGVEVAWQVSVPFFSSLFCLAHPLNKNRYIAVLVSNTWDLGCCLNLFLKIARSIRRGSKLVENVAALLDQPSP